MLEERLEKQILFLKEIEKLKVIYRQNMTIDGKRRENSAEHSWNVALMAVVLAEHADDKTLDIPKVILMLLIHDLVEIDEGDTWLYDDKANEGKARKEIQCAKRLFGLLPDDQRQRFMDLWEEFEAKESKEAVFAASLDAMQPLLNHLWSGGGQILDAKIKASRVRAKKKGIREGSENLWAYSQQIIHKSVAAGIYVDG